MRTHCLHTFILIIMLMTSGIASAQRLLPKQSFIGAEVGFINKPSFTKVSYSCSASASWGMYSRLGYLTTGVFVSRQMIPQEGCSVPIERIGIQPGYLFRVVSDSRKIITLNIGAEGFIGYEAFNRNNPLASGYICKLTGGFLGGVTPVLQAELFCHRTSCVTLTAREYIDFTSKYQRLNFALTLGYRFMILSF